MKEYDVTITETLQRKVTVEARSWEEAAQVVEAEWKNQEHVLDSEDFTEVSFDTVDSREIVTQKEMLDVLLVKPNEYPLKVSLGTELEDLQAAVGGNIEVTYPFEDEVGIILNVEGKMIGLPLNRAIHTEDNDIHDIYAGDFLVVGLTEDSFCSLTPEQMDKFEKMFHHPEMFVKMGRSIMALPLPDDMVKNIAEKATKQIDMTKSGKDRESL